MTTNNKPKRLSTKQFYSMQDTIEQHCCNYSDEWCVRNDDGDYPLCIQHGLLYLVCPYFKDVVLPNNLDLMAQLLDIPKGSKQCRKCQKFFVPAHRNSIYCPICREKVATDKARKRAKKYRDQKKLDRHDC